MNPSLVIDQAKAKFTQALEHFKDEIKKVRTGRAHPGMLDGITIEAYGTPRPLIQVATVSAPEAQLLQIAPFDANNLQAISTAIRENPSLGLNPMDDGRVVRIPVPPLTEERRRELVKVLNGKTEDCMITLRNIRHDALSAIERAKKEKTIGEDDAKRYQKQIDEAMNKAKSDADTLAKTKETEILTV